MPAETHMEQDPLAEKILQLIKDRTRRDPRNRPQLGQ